MWTPLYSMNSDPSNPADQCCIVVSSCDSYSDAWDPFLALFARYWPDCPWPVWWISNEKRVGDPRVQTFAGGADGGWATNLSRWLDHVQPASIIYLQEDYFLQSPVDSTRLQSVVDYALTSGAGFIRLAGSPAPDRDYDNPFGLGELSPGLKFRCSLQAAWWDVATLRQILVAGESGWEMEMAGSRRSDRLPAPFLAVRPGESLIDYFYDTAILKGKWLPGAIDLCRREGIDVDLSNRPVHPRFPLLLKRLRKSRPVSTVRDLFRASSRTIKKAC